MKNPFKFLPALAIAILCFSCDPDKEPVTPTPGDNSGTPNAPATGAVTPLGTPEGTPITASIGPAGGTLQSPDQRLKITIPAGALTENKTISVQPIINHCPSGTGQAYRLTPHDITFAKPASLTFQYDEQDLMGTAPEFLRIAYQSPKGYWQSPPLKSIDTTARTVTVETTHFSDWGVFQNVSLNHGKLGSIILDPGGQVNLKVWGHIETSPNNTNELIIPTPTLLDEKYIGAWEVAAEGSLKFSQGSNWNTYQAPNRIPDKNPVAVSVLLNKTVTIDGIVFRNLRLVANIYVAPEGISVQVDGGGWQNYPGGANINSTQNVVTGKIGFESASVSWKGAPTGVFHWTKSTDVSFNLTKGPTVYQHLYGPKTLNVSGGSLRVDSRDETWIMGTFNLQPAGWIRPSTPPDVTGTANIKGVFRMKRTSSQ